MLGWLWFFFSVLSFNVRVFFTLGFVIFFTFFFIHLSRSHHFFFFILVYPDLMTWLAYLACLLRLAQNKYFSHSFFFHLIGWNLSFIVFLFFLTSSYDFFFIEIDQLIVIICSLKYVWVTWLPFFLPIK